jgi:peroxygenase
VSFWDRAKTGVIYPWNTYDGCRALGFNPLFALTYALAFHLLHTSWWTSTSWFLNPLLSVYVERIHRAKHGSDTGTYDIDGKFHGQSFLEMFSRYDK